MIEMFDFGEALNRLKEGKKVYRVGWNGKGQWVSMVPGHLIAPEDVNPKQPYLRAIADKNGELVTKPYLNMKLVDDAILIGWTPTTTDVLAEDWTEAT